MNTRRYIGGSFVRILRMRLIGVPHFSWRMREIRSPAAKYKYYLVEEADCFLKLSSAERASQEGLPLAHSHNSGVTMVLVRPGVNYGRLVCSDSIFVFAAAAEEMTDMIFVSKGCENYDTTIADALFNGHGNVMSSDSTFLLIDL